MTVQRLSLLQWLGLCCGVVALAFGHLTGFGLTLAECNAGGGRWGIPNDPWEMAILSTAAFVMVLSAAASALVIVRTQEISYEDDPPLSRIRFFAITALLANVLFTLVMMLDLFGNILNAVCRQS